MRLRIYNIGKYDNVDVKLKDLNIVVGKNNTGKSTLGKILYSALKDNAVEENQIEYFKNYIELIKGEIEDDIPPLCIRQEKDYLTPLDLKMKKRSMMKQIITQIMIC